MLNPNERLSSAAYYAQNDDLARRYQTAKPSARKNILDELYRLDLPLFQAWRILKDERDDYRQEAYLWLCRALETYKPTKGPFVAWLRFYIRHTYAAHKQAHKDEDDPDDPDTLPDDSTQNPDPLFWAQVKTQCTPEEWALIEARFLHGLGITEIAQQQGTYPAKVRAPLLRALDKVKSHSLSLTKLHDSTSKVSDLDPSPSRWVRKKDLISLLDLRPEHLKDLLNPHRSALISPFQIDPRDIIRLPSIRIRFLETDKGLIYPRFLRRGSLVPGRGGLL